jgi:predicted permease
MSALRFETRYAMRVLARSPAFTVTAVVALGVAIALVASLAAVLRVTVLQRPPYRDAADLVTIQGATSARCAEECPDLFTWPAFRAIAGGLRGVSALAPVAQTPRRFEVADSSTDLTAAATTSQAFELLGVRPALGRSIQSDDDRPAAPGIAVLSYGVWRRYFQGRREVLGQPIVLDGERFTIVGLMPAGFDYPEGTDLWTNLRSAGTTTPDQRAAFTAVARLTPGTSTARLRQEVALIALRLHEGRAEGDYPGFAVLSTLDKSAARTGPLGLFATVAGVVLILAGVNVQILMLARALARSPELGVRAALGGSRWRIGRPLVIEHALVGLAAGVVAVLLTRALLVVIDSVLAGFLGVGAPLELDWVTGAIAVLAAVALAVGAGLLATLPLLRLDGATAVRGAAAGVIGDRGSARLRLGLVGLESISALLLLAAAGALLKSFVYVEHIELGFDDRVEVARLELDRADRWDAPRIRDAAARIEARLRSLAPVEAATLWSTLGPSMMVKPGEAGVSIESSRREIPFCLTSYAQCPWPNDYQGVPPSFFRTLRIPVLRGRSFDSTDQAGSERVAMVNEAAALSWWPGDNPIGKRFKIGPLGSPNPWITVIGVVRNAQPATELGLDWAARFRDRFFATIYVPLSQQPLEGPGRPEWAATLLLAVRPAAPGSIGPALLRREIQSEEPALRVGPVTPFRRLMSTSWGIGRMRAYLRVIGLLALLGTGLGTLGLAAVVAHAVRARTRELGIRIALGASATAVVRTVAREPATIVLGALLGTLLLLIGFQSVWSALFFGGRGRWPGYIYGTSMLDPAVLGGAVGLFLVAIVAASAVPARRACRIDPATTLRSD